MSIYNGLPFSGRLQAMLGETARRGSDLHEQFLRQRQNGLHGMHDLLAQEIRAAFGRPDAPALFDRSMLEAFGRGRISRCFGPDFARYDERQIPRIPNGDLMMMSRITSLDAARGNFSRPASVTAEYDVPVDGWYFSNRGFAAIPYALMMEIALQPCGFLSAWLDSYALLPDERFFFRNLDGSARLLAQMDLRGQTLVTQARLLQSVTSAGTVIQKFTFDVSCQGTSVFVGETTFGYFSAETMANQVGLDRGQAAAAWLEGEGRDRPVTRLDLSHRRTPDGGRLRFLEHITVSPNSGRYGQGYIYASRPVNPRDWFYPFHFYQDPVMPGSLGVEMVMEAMEAYALSTEMGKGCLRPYAAPPVTGAPMTWRYRGQVTPHHHEMELEVHITRIEQRGAGGVLSGAASVWVDGLRIYELDGVSVGIHEG